MSPAIIHLFSGGAAIKMWNMAWCGTRSVSWMYLVTLTAVIFMEGCGMYRLIIFYTRNGELIVYTSSKNNIVDILISGYIVAIYNGDWCNTLGSTW